MKKNVITYLLLAAALVLPATAAPTIKMLNDSTPAYTIQILQDGLAGYSAGTKISSFCLEASEYFTPGQSYYAELNDDNLAIKGGQDWDNGILGGSRHNVSADPIDSRTAYLFTMFMQNDSRFSNQSMLQEAIHYIEAESRFSNNYVTLANQAVNSGLWSGLGNVGVFNLWDSNGCRAQDQLIMINPVPAPGAVVLGSIGMMFVGYLRRRNTL